MELGYAILIGVLIVIGIYITYLFKNKKSAQIFTMVKELVDEAEKRFGSGTGEIKYAFVVEKIHGVLPVYIKFFISDKLLDLWITRAVDEMQEMLEKKATK